MSLAGIVKSVKKSSVFRRVSASRKDSASVQNGNWTIPNRRPKKVNAHEHAYKETSRRTTHEEDHNSICDFRGVSVSWLVEFQRRLESGDEAPDLELAEFTADCRATCLSNGKSVIVSKGSTARMVSDVGSRSSSRVNLFLPQIGNITASMDRITPKCRTKWTMEDIADFVVRSNEKVWGEGLLYNQVVELSDKRNVGRQFQGAFVVQARRTSFRDCVQAILKYYSNKPKTVNISEEFVWLDVFGAVQCDTAQSSAQTSVRREMAEREKDLLRRMIGSELHHAVVRFDECLVFVDRWKRPVCLTREWCIWELYGRLSSIAPNESARIQIIFSPSEYASFLEEGLMAPGAFEKTVDWLTFVDVRTARCSSAEDKFNIDEQIARIPGSHSTINSKVSAHLKNWVAEEACRVIDRFRKDLPLDEAVCGTNIEGCKQFAKFLYHAGQFQLELGNTEQAVETLSECISRRKKLYGSETLIVAQTQKWVAKALAQQGKFDQALGMLESSLSIQQQLFGSNDSSLVEILVEIGLLLSSRRDAASQDTARDMLDQALEIAKSAKDPKLKITVLVGLGDVLCKQRKYDSAIRRYKKALDVSESISGPKTSEIADIMEKIAVAYYQGKLVEKAIPCEEQVLTIRIRCLGPDHAKTATSRVFLQKLKDSVSKNKGK